MRRATGVFKNSWQKLIRAIFVLQSPCMWTIFFKISNLFREQAVNRPWTSALKNLFLESRCGLLSLLENKLERKAPRYIASQKMTLLSWDKLTLGNNRPEPQTCLIKVLKCQCLFMRLIFLNEGLRIEECVDICSILEKDFLFAAPFLSNSLLPIQSASYNVLRNPNKQLHICVKSNQMDIHHKYLLFLPLQSICVYHRCRPATRRVGCRPVHVLHVLVFYILYVAQTSMRAEGSKISQSGQRNDPLLWSSCHV